MSESAAELSPLLLSAPLRVLLVEDDAHFAWALQRYLEARGCRVEHERDGLAAEGRMRREPLPELVLLDVALPGARAVDFGAVPVLVVAGGAEDGAPLPPGAVGRAVKPEGADGAEAFFRAVGAALQRVREARARCPWGGG